MAALVAVTLVSGPAHSQNLILNPGFETGDGSCTATSWTVNSGGCGGSYLINSPFYFHTGSASLIFFGDNFFYGPFNVSQNVTTAAGKYNFGFWYNVLNASGVPGSAFNASVGSNAFAISTTNTTGGVYTQFTRQVTLPAGSATISFDNNTISSIWEVTIDDVSLTLLQLSPLTSLLPAGAPNNAVNAATSIDAFTNSGGTLPAGFNNLFNLTGSQLVDALNRLASQPGGTIVSSGTKSITYFIDGMFETVVTGDSSGGPSGFGGSAYAAEKKVSRSAAEAYAAVTPREADVVFAHRWNVWATGYGGSSTVNGDASTGSNKTTSNVYGAMAGADYGLSTFTRVGFALGGGGSSFSIDNGFGSGKANMFNAAIYAKHMMGPAYIAGALAYAWQGVTTHRTVMIAGTDVLHASLNANVFTGRIEGGWKYTMPVVNMTPYGAVQSTTFFLPSYGESATSGSNQFALNYGAQNVTATRSELGLRWDRTMPLAGGNIILKAKTAWAHDWNSTRASQAAATFQSLPGSPAFTVNGATPAADLALISAGAEMAWLNGWSLGGTFLSEISSNTRSYGGKGTIKYAFN